MSIKVKLYRYSIAVLFAIVLLFPFHMTAQMAAPSPSQIAAAAPVQSGAKTGLIAGKGLAGRRILESDASRSSLKPGKLDMSKVAVKPQQAATSSSILTGTGAIVSQESKEQGTAESVFMPTNIGGTMVGSNEEDAYAFPVLEGQQVTVDAFSGRIGSEMTAVIELFDVNGNLLAEDAEDEFGDDPFIQYVPTSRTTLFAVIFDEFGLSGSGVFYVLNIEAGVDVSPNSPPDVTPDALPSLDVSAIGDITSASEVDQYSFTGNQGQTLIAACESYVYGGGLVSQLQLIDPSNNLVYFTNSLTDGGDPRFNIVLPYTGEYVITVTPIDGSTGGEYDLNLSLVPSTAGPGAPTLISAVHTKPKLIQVTGTQLSAKSIVEANSVQKSTQKIKKGVLQGKVTGGTGTVITVANLPDLRRSNPILLP
jgi:hypothetical protein